MGAALVAVVAAGLLVGGVRPASAAGPGDRPPALPANRPPVKAAVAAVKPRVNDDKARAAAVTAPPTFRLPEAGATVLDAGRSQTTQLGGLRVSVAPTAGKASTPVGRIRVEVLDKSIADRAAINGPILRLDQADPGARRARTKLALHYGGFADAYGGDYGARLRLVRLPACALVAPSAPACIAPTPVPSSNDARTDTVTADVDISAAGAEPSIFALTASDSSSQGDYAATKVTPSSEWSVATSSGALTWSYPVRSPAVPGGLGPQIALSYSSQAVDGRTATTNNQGSWIGEGFTYEPGYIERRYRSCKDDGHNASADQCWARQNATLVLGGRSSELVQISGTQWKLANDDGSKVELLTGATNGDDNGEHWKVTTTDGVQYYLGLNRLFGWSANKEETNSTWTVPVFGDDSGEPCYSATFANAHCDQAWRWNLDYVKDPHDNVIAYFYDRETNYYARGGRTDINGTAYHRAGHLRRVDYGQRHNAVYTTNAPARVQFETAERCLPSGTVDCDPEDLTDSTAASWPDVPWDRNCAKDTHCKLQQASPTFWTRKRLAKIVTEIRSATTWTPVDSWTLTHLFTNNGDGSRTLWLNKITHAGHVGDTETLPAVELSGLDLPNRVDRTDDNIAPLIRFRLSAVNTDAGAQLDVTYADPDCTAGSLPQPGEHTKRCFPVKWHPNDSDLNPITDWFHKYVVAEVIETDLTGGGPDMVTHYEYLDGAGWRHGDPDGISKSEYLTWNEWRGYGKVRVTRGTGQVMSTRTDYTFLRGLDGDKKPGGGTRAVTVTDSTGADHTDHDEFVGLELENIVYNGSGLVTKTITVPWRHHTATQSEAWGTRRATLVRPNTVRTLTALEAGGWRETRTVTSYDTTYGRVTHVDDHGDTATSDDDQCSRSWYANNPTTGLVGLVSRVETVSVKCATNPDRRTQVLSDKRTFYDELAHGAAPIKGDVTKVERLASHDGTTAVYVTVSESTYDPWGREQNAKDALGNTTTTTYTQTNGLLTKTEVKNPLQHKTITEYSPAWNLPIVKIDPNGNRTDLEYDPLGRLTNVWLPDRLKQSGLTPSIRHTYRQQPNAIVAVKTEKIQKDGDYAVQYELYDGHLRLRQTQQEGPEGGRLVTDTFYTGTGKIARKNDTYFAAGPPAHQLLAVSNGDVDAQTIYVYDGADRVTNEIAAVRGEERWRTITTYGGDRVHHDPPTGGTPKTTVLDGRGRVSELWQYKATAPSGDHISTRYTYHPSGQLASLVDAAGNTWSYTYDQRGRKITSSDPDSGTTTYSYDDLDRVVGSVDEDGDALSHTYDELGRKTATYVGAVATGTKVLAWTYDTVSLGQLYSAARYVNGKAYGVVYPSRDEFYRPVRTRYVIPDDAGTELKGTYEFTASYNRDGTILGTGMPAAGGLPAEGITYGYDDVERPTSMTGTNTYVTETAYAQTGVLQQVTLNTGGKKAYLTWTYEEGTNRLTRFEVKRQDVAIDMDAHYEYDDAGNVTSIADTPVGGMSDVQCFQYDYLFRVSDAWTSSSTATDRCAGGPATTGVGGPAPYHHSYSYDDTGNRTVETIHGLNGVDDTIRNYNYPASGQDHPHGVAQVSEAGPAGQRTFSYEYDDAGNTTKRTLPGRSQTLNWDAEGHLTSITEGGQTTSFVYDTDGNRLVRKEPNATTVYLPGMELRLNHATRVVDGTRYYSFGGRTIAVRGITGVRFLAIDHHGTAHLAIDAATGTLTRRRTTPFGELRGTPPATWPSERGFVGGTQDRTTGLTQLGARAYDPTLGRFISADPVVDNTDPQQLNGYAYANNNPITLSDPSGLKPYDDEQHSGRGGDNSSLHNFALYLSAIMAKYYMAVVLGLRGEITTDLGEGGRKRNTIPGANKKGNRKPGVADMIFWGEDVVYVWEVKPNSNGELEAGREQLDRYIAELQAELRRKGDHRKVLPGPWLPPVRGVPTGNGKVLDVWSDSRRPGLLIYGTRQAPSPKPPGDWQPRPVPVPAPQPRPVTAPTGVEAPTTQPMPPGIGVVPHPHPGGPYGTCPGPGCAMDSGGSWPVHWDPPSVGEVAGAYGTAVAVTGVAIACLLTCWLAPA